MLEIGQEGILCVVKQAIEETRRINVIFSFLFLIKVYF